MRSAVKFIKIAVGSNKDIDVIVALRSSLNVHLAGDNSLHATP